MGESAIILSEEMVAGDNSGRSIDKRSAAGEEGRPGWMAVRRKEDYCIVGGTRLRGFEMRKSHKQLCIQLNYSAIVDGRPEQEGNLTSATFHQFV